MTPLEKVRDANRDFRLLRRYGIFLEPSILPEPMDNRLTRAELVERYRHHSSGFISTRSKELTFDGVDYWGLSVFLTVWSHTN